MPSEYWQRIEDLFHQALAVPKAERDAWLAQACPDPAIREQVERLLASRTGETGRFIDAAVKGAADELMTAQSLAGQQFGAWRLMREIGHGGMGSVWLAERADEAYRAQVAIKFVRGAFLSPELGRRFLAERQILADLQHPNIARLVDGGAAPDGTPFFAMEYVPGEPITTYAWSRGLGLEARLRLFLTVCEAVQHAHRGLVVHRDLKPSNILVGEDGIPKLVDFGIAKLLDAAAGEETTALLRPMTPAYASPEQVRGERVTVSSDVFSLGVVLYELLTGEQPFRSGSDTTEEVQRRVVHDEPGLPSGVATRPADSTKFVPARSLVGDLDNIVMMALRKEPERRYPTVEHLADDLRRHMAGEPVQARPSTVRYRLGKFVKRNRSGVIGATAAVVLVAGLVTFYTVRLARERNIAQREQATADQVTSFLTEMFRDADPTRALGEAVTVRQAMDRGRERLRTELADQPRVRARLLNALGTTYSNLALYATADTVLREALALVEAVNGPDDVQTGNVLQNLANLEQRRAGTEAGLAWAERAVRIHEMAGDARQLGASLHTLGALMYEISIDSAIALFERSLALHESVGGPLDPEALAVRHSIGTTWIRGGDYRRAITELRSVKEGRDSVLPAGHPARAITLNALAIAYERIEVPDSARELWEEAVAVNIRAFGPDHPETATALANLATAMQSLGAHDSSLALLERALDIRTRQFGEAHESVANALMTIGNSHQGAGEIETSIPYYERAIAVYEQVLPPDHRSLHYPNYNLGVAFNALERWADAVPRLRRGYEIALTALGPDHPSAAISLHALGVSLKALGDTVEAKRLWAESLDKLQRSLGSEHTWITYPAESLAETLVQQRQWAEAETLYSRYMPVFEKRYASDPDGMVTTLEYHARALRGMGETVRADSVDSRARELRAAKDGGA